MLNQVRRDPLTGLDAPPPKIPSFVPHEGAHFELLVLVVVGTPALLWGCTVLLKASLGLLAMRFANQSRGKPEEATGTASDRLRLPSARRILAALVAVAAVLAFASSTAGHVLDADPFAVLGVSTDASQAEVRKAFRTAVKGLHPDKRSTNDDSTSAELQRLLDAYAAVTSRHGGPTGRYAFDVLIGLPEWAGESDALVFASYFAVLGALVLVGTTLSRRWRREQEEEDARLAAEEALQEASLRELYRMMFRTAVENSLSEGSE
jgi:DnaJ domain